jgi:hypothetical protein
VFLSTYQSVGGLERHGLNTAITPRFSAKAIPACAGTEQLNAALAGRQWFHPKDTPWRQMITKKAEENAARIRPQIHEY